MQVISNHLLRFFSCIVNQKDQEGKHIPKHSSHSNNFWHTEYSPRPPDLCHVSIGISPRYRRWCDRSAPSNHRPRTRSASSSTKIVASSQILMYFVIYPLVIKLYQYIGKGTWSIHFDDVPIHTGHLPLGCFFFFAFFFCFFWRVLVFFPFFLRFRK